MGGWKGATSERQPAMYFPNGGGPLKGVSKPGEIVWSRIYIVANKPEDGSWAGPASLSCRNKRPRRREATTPQWPIMHAVTYGISRDQMMARHKSNHIQVAYANSEAAADDAMLAKAAMAARLGMVVNIGGSRKNGKPW